MATIRILLERVAKAQAKPVAKAAATDFTPMLEKLGPSLRQAFDPLVGRLQDNAER